jgi:hypothetical protein
MEKLNFDLLDDISLTFNGDELLNVSAVKAYSWGLVMKKQEVLDQTVEYIEKYYKEQDNIENVIRNTDKLWETLTDHVAENNAQDFIDQGFLKLSKEKLLEEYYRYVEPFFNEIQYLNDCYFDITADEDQKQAYREARKENRSRVMGIGFGITGGIKASISAGIANAATGMAHSAFNAIANGIGNISKNNKLVDFYNDEETLEHLIDGWAESFWLIIDGQIELINSLLVEDGTSKIFNYSQMTGFKHSAENIFSNLQKAKNMDNDAYFEAIAECIQEFPLETTYWKLLASIFCNSGKFSIEICNAFDTTFSQLGKYVEDLYADFVTDMVVMMIDGYVDNLNIGKNDIASATLEVLDKKLDAEEYKNIFDAIIMELIASKDVEADIVRGVFDLLYKLKNVNIDDYKNNEEIKEQFTKKQNNIAFDFVTEEENAFLFTELQNGNIDAVAKYVKSAAPLVDTEWVVRIMTYVINIRREKGEIVVTRELIDNIEKLKNALSVDFDLNELKSFYDMNNSVKDAEAVEERKNMTLEAKVKEFNNDIEDLVKEHGSNFLGKKAYWGTLLSSKIISNAKKSMGIKEDTEILLLFDDTVFGSGKAGFVITSAGIVKKLSDYCWIMDWKEIIEKSDVTFFECYDTIAFENNKKNKDKFKRIISFSDNGPDIDKKILASLIKMACRIFYGSTLDIYTKNLSIDEWNKWLIS